MAAGGAAVANAPPQLMPESMPVRERAPSAASATSAFAESSIAEPMDPDDTPGWTANYARQAFSAQSFFPPITWVPRYMRSIRGRATKEDKRAMGLLPYSVRGDLLAGLAVGIMLVPQCVAFAVLAHLPVQVGLYSSFMPLVAYSLFGTFRQVQPGPTAIMSLLTGQALDSLGVVEDPGSSAGSARVAGAALMALLVGLLSMLLGLVRMGFIVDFMSHSVMSSFCTAAGLTIVTSQLGILLGITVDRRKTTMWETAHHLLTHLGEAHEPTVALGCSLLALTLILRFWRRAGTVEKRLQHPLWRWFPRDERGILFKSLKLAADLSSLICIVVGWLWGLGYRRAGIQIRLVGEVDTDGFAFVDPAGHPIISELIRDTALWVSASVIAVVGFLETMAVGGKFAVQSRYSYEANQELLALGFANIGSALMSGYPVTGSFTRTAVNVQYGATSLFSCATSSTLVFAAMYALLPVIALLPLASLAPIIIQGAIGVISVNDFRIALRSSPSEFVVMLATLTACLALTVKEGLVTGFILSVLKTMNDLAHPNLAVCGRLGDNSFRDVRNFPQAELLPCAVVVRMDARLSFANTRKMKEFVLKAVDVREREGDKIEFVVIDGKSINHVDLTGCEMLELLAETLNARNQQLIVANLKGPVGKCLASAGVADAIQRNGGHLCHDMPDAIKIIARVDPSGREAAQNLNTLVKRVDTARVQMAANNQPIWRCGREAADASQARRRSKEHGINERSIDSTTSPHSPAHAQPAVQTVGRTADEIARV